MRSELDGLLRDITLRTLTFAIALGWSLFQLARGVASFIDALLTHLPSSAADAPYFTGQDGGLTWVVGRRVVALDGILLGLVELAFVLAVAAVVRVCFAETRRTP